MSKMTVFSPDSNVHGVLAVPCGSHQTQLQQARRLGMPGLLLRSCQGQAGCCFEIHRASRWNGCAQLFQIEKWARMQLVPLLMGLVCPLPVACCIWALGGPQPTYKYIAVGMVMSGRKEEFLRSVEKAHVGDCCGESPGACCLLYCDRC